MKIQQKQIAVITLVLYIKSCCGKEGWQHYWDPKVNECTSCIIFDEKGYEIIACKENRTEDTVGQCANDKVQRVKNFSEQALEILLELNCPSGYERIHGKQNGTDDTDRKYLPGKVHPIKNSSEYSLEGMDKQQCTEDISTSSGNNSIVEHMSKSNTHNDDLGLSAFMNDSRCMTYFETSGLTNIVDKLNASVQEKQRMSRDLYLCGSDYSYIQISDVQELSLYSMVSELAEYNISIFGEDIFTRPSISIQSGVTTSAPTQLYIVDTSQSSGQNSYIEWTQVIHTGSIFIFIVIITAVSVTCVKCYVDRRLRALNRATENEHEPLHNHNSATYVPMEDLNINRTSVPCELQESDQNDHNGNVNSSPVSPEIRCESESEGLTGSQSNDSFHAAGSFCRCCGLHWTRCKKRMKKQRIVPVQPQQRVNEMPTTETADVEVLVDGYSNFSSSIFYYSESHGSTNTVDEETTHVKSVYSNEQVSSTVEQANEAERSCFEESQQADLHNEDHITTGN